VTSVAVVGAGITGLGCAAALAGEAEVTVIDRIPVAGGVHGWDRDETRRLVAEAGGARMLLGETATRWDGRELVVIGQDGARRLRADALVVATGTRPLGRAELGIEGGRPAGILAATVACHLAENGVVCGLRPVVYGGGDWAARAVRGLLAGGALAITVVAPDGVRTPLPPDGRVDVRVDSPVVGVTGSPRVESVRLGDGVEIPCDALVLAQGLVAVRNVDGAVWEGDRVVFAQPLDDPASVDAAEQAGREAAEAVRSAL
jgi:thioredoxin reductase